MSLHIHLCMRAHTYAHTQARISPMTAIPEVMRPGEDNGDRNSI